jgi:hypothetical protein
MTIAAAVPVESRVEAGHMTVLKRGLTAAIAVSMIMVVVQCAQNPEIDQVPGIASAAVAIDGWRMDYEPEIYVGDTLYELINGGAEVYHRFGFVQALATQYSDAENRSISLEVFEMRDIEGARNIYSDKTGGSGETLDIGDEAAGEDYYLNFRSGNYLVTITGFDSQPETRAGILNLARAVATELGGRQ